jgi:hypothetical protein
MDKVRIPSGGVRANVRAGEDLPADTLWKYSTTENEVTLCGSGEEADGICLSATLQDEILNQGGGSNYSRKDTGVYDNLSHDGTLTTIGAEWMSGASGVLTAYVAVGTNRPLGKVLAVNEDDTVKVTFYSK